RAVDGGILHLASSFRITTATLGTMQAIDGGKVQLHGQLNNTNSTLHLDNGTGSLFLIRSGSDTGTHGTIIGGRIRTSESAALVVIGGVLDGVTLESDIEVVDTVARVRNGITLDGTSIHITSTAHNDYGILRFMGSEQEIAG